MRAFFEAFNRQDFQTAVTYLDLDVEIYPAIGGELDVSRSYRGRDEARKLFETISEGVKPSVEIEDAIEAEDGQVLQVERWTPRGRQGIETPFEIGTVYAFRDDLVVRIEGFRDREKAFAAAGLAD